MKSILSLMTVRFLKFCNFDDFLIKSYKGHILQLIYNVFLGIQRDVDHSGGSNIVSEFFDFLFLYRFIRVLTCMKTFARRNIYYISRVRLHFFK